MGRGNPLRIRDRRAAVLIGIGLLAAGGWVLHDAFEGRGRDRPFWVKFLSNGWV